MHTIRRILTLLITAGLLTPGMQVAGSSCRGDACPLHRRQATPPITVDACCGGDAATPHAGESGDDDCCSDGGCDCMCCAVPVLPAPARSTPALVKMASRADRMGVHRSVLAPQDAVGALLRPPQA